MRLAKKPREYAIFFRILSSCAALSARGAGLRAGIALPEGRRGSDVCMRKQVFFRSGGAPALPGDEPALFHTPYYTTHRAV